MQERDPDTDLRKIDQDNQHGMNHKLWIITVKIRTYNNLIIEEVVEEDDDEEEEEENDEDAERKAEEAKKSEEQAASSYINPDADEEERQFEFIELMKQRFIDGKDPDFGKNILWAACFRWSIRYFLIQIMPILTSP